MIKFVFLSILLVTAEQGTTYKNGQIFTTGTTIPNTCAVGAVYIKTTSPIGVYICTANNVWTNTSNSGMFGGQPTVSNCGTSPSVNGTDQAGIINVGTGIGTITSCTLTFSIAFTTIPSCVATGNSATINVGLTTTTTNMIISTGSSLVGGKIYYHCYGR